MGTKCVVKEYDAVGGPATSSKDRQGNEQGPTENGTYVVAGAWPHQGSALYKDWSTIPWGAPLREEPDGSISVKMKGKWQPTSKFSRVSRADIIDEYFRLYGKNEVPKKWVFNDFGHVAVFMFKDTNGNLKIDKKLGEKIHPEFMHTTPPDEATEARGGTAILTESHGCIHVKPSDIDEMLAKGYIKPKRTLVVHSYSETFPLGLMCSESGKEPFEVHFYPGLKKIYVLGEM